MVPIRGLAVSYLMRAEGLHLKADNVPLYEYTVVYLKGCAPMKQKSLDKLKKKKKKGRFCNFQHPLLPSFDKLPSRFLIYPDITRTNK